MTPGPVPVEWEKESFRADTAPNENNKTKITMTFIEYVRAITTVILMILLIIGLTFSLGVLMDITLTIFHYAFAIIFGMVFLAVVYSSR